jgi:hypothetical protein
MSVMIFKSIRKKGTSKSYWVVERAGGSSFFEEPNKNREEVPSPTPCSPTSQH